MLFVSQILGADMQNVSHIQYGDSTYDRFVPIEFTYFHSFEMDELGPHVLQRGPLQRFPCILCSCENRKGRAYAAIDAEAEKVRHASYLSMTTRDAKTPSAHNSRLKP